MSTKFLRATHRNGFTTSLHDSEFPIGLFREIYREDYSSLSGFTVDLLDYKGDLLESNFNWSDLRVTVALGDLVEGGYAFTEPVD